MVKCSIRKDIEYKNNNGNFEIRKKGQLLAKKQNQKEQVDFYASSDNNIDRQIAQQVVERVSEGAKKLDKPCIEIANCENNIKAGLELVKTAFVYLDKKPKAFKISFNKDDGSLAALEDAIKNKDSNKYNFTATEIKILNFLKTQLKQDLSDLNNKQSESSSVSINTSDNTAVSIKLYDLKKPKISDYPINNSNSNPYDKNNLTKQKNTFDYDVDGAWQDIIKKIKQDVEDHNDLENGDLVNKDKFIIKNKDGVEVAKSIGNFETEFLRHNEKIDSEAVDIVLKNMIGAANDFESPFMKIKNCSTLSDITIMSKSLIDSISQSNKEIKLKLDEKTLATINNLLDKNESAKEQDNKNKLSQEDLDILNFMKNNVNKKISKKSAIDFKNKGNKSSKSKL